MRICVETYHISLISMYIYTESDKTEDTEYEH
jgi:hypothetical protein